MNEAVYIPAAEEVAAKTYFLQSLNTPVVITAIRIAVILIAVFLLCTYIYAMKKGKESQKDRSEQ